MKQKRRTKQERSEAERLLALQVWYNRHQARLDEIESGKATLSEAQQPFFDGALKNAAAFERDYPGQQGPWTDFEWGMINGKLSALRWMAGEEWDELYT